MIDGAIILAFLVGLIIFIHGIENFSYEILRSSGDRFRRVFSAATKNRLLAAFSGMVVTGLIQSSTATTVITISLVSAGVISFAQSLGIVVGANIGTTITAQLVAFKITHCASVFIVLGFVLGLVKKTKYLGKGLFYFGLVFFGLNLISDAISPIRNHPQVVELFSSLSNPYAALLAGLAFTAVVQSSSVATGLVVVLAASGVLDLEQGIPILLGTNIGTTVSALYASLRLDRYAKRAAVAHTIFNLAGVLLVWPFLGPLTDLIHTFGGSAAQQIANAHMVFNVTVAIIFLFILKPYRRLIEKLVKVDQEEILLKPKYLMADLPASKKRAFSLIEKELSHFLHVVFRFYEKTIQYMKSPSENERIALEKYEVLSDLLDEKIEAALLKLSQQPLSNAEAKKIVLLVRISNLVEQLADTAKSLGVQSRTLSSPSISLSFESTKSIEKIYERMRGPFYELQKAFPKKIMRVTLQKKRLTSVHAAVVKSYNDHVKRLKAEQAYAGSVFVESSSLLENGASKIKEIITLADRYVKITGK